MTQLWQYVQHVDIHANHTPWKMENSRHTGRVRIANEKIGVEIRQMNKYKLLKPVCPRCKKSSTTVMRRIQRIKTNKLVPFETVRYCGECNSILHYNSFKKSWKVVISLGKRSKWWHIIRKRLSVNVPIANNWFLKEICIANGVYWDIIICVKGILPNTMMIECVHVR